MIGVVVADKVTGVTSKLFVNYVVQRRDGSIVEIEKEVARRNPRSDILHVPARCFMFFYYRRIVMTVNSGGEINTTSIDRVNAGNITYVNGKLFGRRDLPMLPWPATDEDVRQLLSTMLGLGWSHVVRSRYGRIYPFFEDRDKVAKIRYEKKDVADDEDDVA